VTQRDAAALKAALEERFELYFELADAPEGEAPVAISNPKYMQALSSVLESYSLPGPGEFDPLPIMSIFYYFMFGMMLSDAGYGIVITAVCGICLLKFKNMDENWKANLRMFLLCGVSTIFWGAMFSSYFGDALNVISRVFFGHEIGIPPIWFSPLDDPMLLLVFCLGIGIVHLSTGYLLKARWHWAHKRLLDGIYDGVFPVLMLLPLVLIFMTSSIFNNLAGFTITLPSWATYLCLGISVLCMIGILLTSGRESRGIKRLMKGAYNLYSTLTGWLSDAFSYSRLLALGLATGVVATVMNQIGSMAGSGVVGIILYVLVFALGQTLNFGINTLGAYVHSNRLEYVEFFGKFYEGGGRKFSPFGVHTKHIKLEEAK
jgi:V/A-type H+-transporting ATPase subunit I